MKHDVGSTLDGPALGCEKRGYLVHIFQALYWDSVEQTAEKLDGDITRFVEGSRGVYYFPC